MGLKQKKKAIEIDRIFPTAEFFLFGGQILHIRLHSKITLNSATKLKAIKLNTNSS